VGTPAEEFGPYVVYEQIGLGGMATVHRAEAQGIAGFSKQVALKRMLPNVATDASLVKSFIREARLASHMRHANVAQTYDLGKVGETYFIAMELVPGHDLREILEHCATVAGPMPVALALNIVGQICDALDYAHNLCDETGQPLGIIHRDVSPPNIIVSEGGIVKLIDFGIAKASGGVQTQTGTIKGKCGYMAPEYLMGSSIDTRADLFAVGVIAHELLANRPLFQGKDDMDTLYRLSDMPIFPPSRVNPQVPPELDAVVMTALDRDPNQRWQRASVLRSALLAEGKTLGLYAHDSQVFEWIDWAFRQKARQVDERSEPASSITTGTMQLEMPRGTRPGNGIVPRDEFSPESDSLDTHVRPSGSKPIQQQEATADASRSRDLPTQPLRPSAQLRAVPDPDLLAKRDRSAPVPNPERLDAKRDRGPVGAYPQRKSAPQVAPGQTQRNTRPSTPKPARQDPDKTRQDPARPRSERPSKPLAVEPPFSGFDSDQPTVAASVGYQQALLDTMRDVPRGTSASAPVDREPSSVRNGPHDVRRTEFDDDPPTIAAPDGYEAAVRDSRPALGEVARRTVRASDEVDHFTPAPVAGTTRPDMALDDDATPTPVSLASLLAGVDGALGDASPVALPPGKTRSDSAFDGAATPTPQPADTLGLDDDGTPTPMPRASGELPALDAPKLPPPALRKLQPARSVRTSLGHAVDPWGAMPQAGHGSAAISGPRAAPHLPSGRKIIQAPLDADLGSVLDELAGGFTPAPPPPTESVVQGSSVQTRVEALPRAASRVLLAVLVLIAAAGAAAVVYFVLPYLT
jgi:serine/threonine protein kinase